MILEIQGDLVSITTGLAALRCGAITYELLIPACDEQRLNAMVGQTITFHTLHYLESQGQGSSFFPRLIGFQTAEDRAFFKLFTTVKGIGNRKGLRALQMPVARIAEAIAARDHDLLRTLPEIGKRTAETIVLELKDKVDRFVEIKPMDDEASLSPETRSLREDAVAVLAQLGEQTMIARQLVDRALTADSTIDRPDELVTAALRLKEI